VRPQALASVILALALAACGDGEKSAPAPAGKETAKSGSQLYASQGCALCHAQDGTGTSFGPTLHGKKSFWTREKLVQYLKNPAAYAESDPRLVEQKKKFSAMAMQRYDMLSDAELGAIADFVLGLP
jgi:mono/diheme cytochrome c family protein